MSDNREKRNVSWKEGVTFILFRAVDGGLLPFIVLAGLILGALWILTSGLESGDRLTLLQQIVGSGFFSWAGWMFFVVSVLVSGWLLERQRRQLTKNSEKLETENRMARERLEQAKLPFDSDTKPGSRTRFKP